MELSSSWKWRIEKKKEEEAVRTVKNEGPEQIASSLAMSPTFGLFYLHIQSLLLLRLLFQHHKHAHSLIGKRKMRPRVSRKWREKRKKNERMREGNLLGSPIIRVTAVCRLIKRVALSVCHRRFRRPSNCGCSQIWIGPKVYTIRGIFYL